MNDTAMNFSNKQIKNKEITMNVDTSPVDENNLAQKNIVKTSVNNKKSISSAWLQNFSDIYQQLSTDNLHLIEQIYHSDVVFSDPIHRIQGLQQLKSYFDGLYTNLSSCDFIIDHVVEQGDEATVFWTMTYQHNKLNKGQSVTVEGCSHLTASEGKVIYHRDYLDLGAMLYEQIPFLGNAIKWIKHKAAK